MNSQELLGNYLELFCRLALAGIFLTAGIAKLFDLPGGRNAMSNFGVPKIFVRSAAIVLPIIELIIVIFLLSPDVIWYGALGALVLLSIFTLGMFIQLSGGNAPDCHCFGQLYSKPVGIESIFKNALIAVPAIVLLVTAKSIDLETLHGWISGSLALSKSLNFIFYAAFLACLLVLIYYVKNLFEETRGLNRRLDSMEPGAAPAHQHHEHMTAPEEGLPIGATVPEFELPDMQGRALSFDQLMMRGKPILFFFISPTCAPCKGLLPEIEKWQEEFAGKVEFIFVSSGSVDENSAKLPQLGGQVLLLQKKREAAEIFKAKWTPTAILVNANGLIASRPAPGDAAIRELIDQIRESDLENFNHVENGRGMSSSDLKIGEEIPEFELPDVSGTNASDKLIRGKKTLALFWGLDCMYCQRMLPDVKEWEKTANGAVQMVIFSTGDEAENRAMNLKSPILMDEGNKVGTQLGMSGTPSAVLIDESGKIISETAIGAEQIWSLIGKRK